MHHPNKTLPNLSIVSQGKANVFVTDCILPLHPYYALNKRSLAFVHNEHSRLSPLTLGFMGEILGSFKLYCVLAPLRDREDHYLVVQQEAGA